jgi:murein DD-endopeptidase MepM/ murein hydrolase activator NlpD
MVRKSIRQNLVGIVAGLFIVVMSFGLGQRVALAHHMSPEGWYLPFNTDLDGETMYITQGVYDIPDHGTNGNTYDYWAIDYAAGYNFPIRLPYDGTFFASYNCDTSGGCGGGLILVVSHPDGHFSRYLHLSSITMPNDGLLKPQG